MESRSTVITVEEAAAPRRRLQQADLGTQRRPILSQCLLKFALPTFPSTLFSGSLLKPPHGFHRVADDLGLRRPGCVESAAKVSWQEPPPKDPKTETEGNQMKAQKASAESPQSAQHRPQAPGRMSHIQRSEGDCLGWGDPQARQASSSLYVGHPCWSLGSALGTLGCLRAEVV